MNLFSSGLGNMFRVEGFRNLFPVILEEREYPNISIIGVVDDILDT